MVSAFDVIGPSMIGPSSSHTAGAVRIGLLARSLLGAAPTTARIELHGSFAATGKGHATDRALVAGLLEFATDDERLKESLELAEKAGLAVSFEETDLGEDVHPNTARVTLETAYGAKCVVAGSSIGGGMIVIGKVDGYATSFSGESETLVLWHRDNSGYLAKVTTLLACVEANIGTIRTSRRGRGAEALTVLEVDAPLPEDLLRLLGCVPATRQVRNLGKLPT